MTVKQLIVAAALLSAAATAQAGWISVIPEPASVTLVFIALAIVGFALRPKKRPASTES
jgi:hypothetical protein